MFAPMSVSPIQHIAIKYLASGWTAGRVAEELKLTIATIKAWKNQLEFREALQKAIVVHVDLVEAMLVAGEAAAAETLLDALKATNTQGKANWTVRVQAAITLLDRAGMRGRAIERSAVAVGGMKVGAMGTGGGGVQVEESLRKALRDPGVRAWLKETGAMGQLSAGDLLSDEVVVEVETDGLEETVSAPDTAAEA